MTTLEAIRTTVQRPEPDAPFDEAHLAAAAFLARCSGRTLDAYRHDPRAFFQWATDNGSAATSRAADTASDHHFFTPLPTSPQLPDRANALEASSSHA